MVYLSRDIDIYIICLFKMKWIWASSRRFWWEVFWKRCSFYDPLCLNRMGQSIVLRNFESNSSTPKKNSIAMSNTCTAQLADAEPLNFFEFPASICASSESCRFLKIPSSSSPHHRRKDWRIVLGRQARNTIQPRFQSTIPTLHSSLSARYGPRTSSIR